MNYTFCNEDYAYIHHEPNPIELIGYAMTNIPEAKRKASQLPAEYADMLSLAHALLCEVQEYLYEN